MRIFKKRYPVLFVYTDASVQAEATGLGTAIKDDCGKLVAWRNKTDRAMTCNEAEYAALLFALEQAAEFHPATMHVYSDSRLVVDQILGRAAVTCPELKRLHRRACDLLQKLPRWTLTHIPRERNELADAIAGEAIQAGKPDRPGESGTGRKRNVRCGKL